MTEPAAGVISSVRNAITQRKIAAEEIVRTALERIDTLNPAINAVVAMRADEALAEARALDQVISAGGHGGPLAGIPVLVKDLEDVAGMRTTQGSLLFADASVAQSDGLVPSRLRAAGAIVVGKTNLPEFACEGFTSNLVFGATRNPWSTDWSPGGSSGGSAAALAAGMVPVATATDGGGSIRIPSAFCGLVGIKPSHGVIGRRPIPDWIDLSTDGPLATTVADLRLLLSLEAGPVWGDPSALPALDLSPGLMPKRLLVSPRLSSAGPLPDSIARSFEAAVKMVSQTFGLAAELAQLDALWSAGDPSADWLVMAAADHVHRLGRSFVTASLERMTNYGRAFMELGLDVAIDDYIAVRRRRFEYARRLDEILGTDAVLVSPTVAVSGFLADGRMAPSEELGPIPIDAFNTELISVTGLPAINIPAGVSPNGIPFGVQVIAPRFREGLLLKLAGDWERERRWPRVAPGFDSFEVTLGLGL